MSLPPTVKQDRAAENRKGNPPRQPGPGKARVFVVVAGLMAAIAAASALMAELALSVRLSPLLFYVVLMVAAGFVNVMCVLIWNPVLIDRRLFPGAGTKGWDIALLVCAFVPSLIGVFVVALQDSGDLISSAPAAVLFPGLVLFISSWVLITWTMMVNPFFEKTVRIQSDQGHHVIDAGPYRYIRHPGYVGFSAWILATPLCLVSPWSFVPAILAVGTLVFRTVLEDRLLRRELDGYDSYARQVRFRLIPGVW